MGARQSGNLHPKTWWANLSCAACTSLLAGQGLAADGHTPSAAPDRDWKAVAVEMGLPPVPDAEVLVDAGTDIYGRRLRLSPETRDAWQEMRAAAREDGVELQAISGFRSRIHQARLVLRKLQSGLSLHKALAINAAPGYSEHHSGSAIDITGPGSPPAEEVFELTPAFSWLAARAGEFGFSMSYPRGNSHGVTYEPWHWRWSRAAEATSVGCTATDVGCTTSEQSMAQSEAKLQTRRDAVPPR